MEQNINIIRNVRKFPQLYQKNSNAADRQKIWKFLSKTMKLDEQFLKSRWYILRERYAKELQSAQEDPPTQPRRSTFKYHRAMEFLKEHIRIRPSTNAKNNENIPSNWVRPEFIITEADLETENDNGEIEELIFMDVEETTEENLKEIENAVVISEEIRFEHEVDEESQPQENPEPQQAMDEVQNDNSESTTLESSARSVLQKEPDRKVIVEKIETKQDEQAEVVEVLRPIKERNTSDDKAKDKDATYPKEEHNESKDKNSRSEDAIFGELVAAMLQTMEPGKKKTVKKEIMNLLLS